MKHQTWTGRVRKVYGSLEELRSYGEIYGIARRCGYKSCAQLWKDNPRIGGSINPEDFGLAGKGKKAR